MATSSSLQEVLGVYRGLLVKHSAVFADMFATRSADATETFDGCPVVHLSDHPEDLKDLLICMMSCSTVKTMTCRTGAPASYFSELHAAIHLAHKYQCPDIELCAILILKTYYTAEFSDNADHFYTSSFALSPPPPDAAIAAVNIARLTGTPSMLPFPLYLVCTLEDRMLDQYTRRDGSVEHLTPEDLRLCIRARRELAREKAALVKTVFTVPMHPIGRSDEGQDILEICSTELRDAVDEVERYARGECHVLRRYRRVIGCWLVIYGMCRACQKKLLQHEVEEMKRVWMLLPGMFGLAVRDCGFTNGDEYIGS